MSDSLCSANSDCYDVCIALSWIHLAEYIYIPFEFSFMAVKWSRDCCFHDHVQMCFSYLYVKPADFRAVHAFGVDMILTLCCTSMQSLDNYELSDLIFVDRKIVDTPKVFILSVNMLGDLFVLVQTRSSCREKCIQ